MVAYLCLICGFIGVIVCLGELAARTDYPGRKYVAVGYLAYGLLMIQVWALASEAIHSIPWMLYWSAPLIFLLGWSFARFLRHSLGLDVVAESGSPKLALLKDSAPVWIIFLLTLPLMLQPAEQKLANYANALAGRLQPLDKFQSALLAAGFAYQGGAIGLTMWRARDVASSMHQAPHLLALRAFIAAVLLFSLLGVAVRVFGDQRAVQALGASAALLLPAFYLFGRRYPQFFRRAREEVQRARYENSRLKSLDLADLQQRLEQLMLEEEVFADEALNLESLAAHSGVTAHQLSEFLNAHLNLSFPAFVAGHRIRKARELLEREPDRSIIDVGFAVGFGAKSSFNSAFRAVTGQSPGEYRRARRESRGRSSGTKRRQGG